MGRSEAPEALAAIVTLEAGPAAGAHKGFNFELLLVGLHHAAIHKNGLPSDVSIRRRS
jgi:hypothetical protein